MTSIREILRPYIDKSGKDQQNFALDWYLQIQELEPEFNGSESGAISQLSRLLSEKVEQATTGAKFYFETPVRSKLLLDLLDVAKLDRRHVRDAVRELLDETTMTASVVFDLGSLRDFEESHAKVLYRQFLSGKALGHVCLLVPNKLRLEIPKLLDELGHVSVEYLESRQEIDERIEELALRGALIVSNQVVDPFEQWVAMDLRGGRFRFAPRDWSQSAQRGEVLDPLPDVEQPLDEKTLRIEWHEADKPFQDRIHDNFHVSVPYAARDRRLLMVALRSPDRWEELRDKLNRGYSSRGPDDIWSHRNCPSALTRFLVARELGLDASSTPEERPVLEIVRLVDELEIKFDDIREAKSNELDAIVREARLWPEQAPEAVRLTDTEERVLLNPGEDQFEKVAEEERVAVRHYEVGRTALEALVEKAEARTPLEWLKDAHGERLVEALLDEGYGLEECDAARFGLLYAGAISREIEPSPEASLEVLGAMVKLPMPQPMLFGRSHTFCEAGHPVPSSLLQKGQTDAFLFGVPLLGSFLQRDETYTVIAKDYARPDSWSENEQSEATYSRTKATAPLGWVPSKPQDAVDIERWKEHLLRRIEGQRSEHRYDGGSRTAWSDGRYVVGLDTSELWARADRSAASVRLALRRAVAKGESLPMNDGRLLVPLGGGVTAFVTLWEEPSAGETACCALEIEWTVEPDLGPEVLGTSLHCTVQWRRTASETAHKQGLPPIYLMAGSGWAALIEFDHFSLLDD
jgi:hypothetical protein